MACPLLSSADNPSIRASIDLALDAEALPDAVIALAIYEPRAELFVQTRDPQACTRTDATQVRHLKNAAILWTAGLIAPAIPEITQGRVSARGAGYTRKVDYAARAADLIAKADEEINIVLFADGTTTEDRPLTFALASSGRDWQLPPGGVPGVPITVTGP